jgi:hypothetical protein
MFDKQTIQNKANIPKKEILFACPSNYFGGISSELINKPEEGCIGLTNKKIIFVNLAWSKKNQRIIKIPINKVIKSKIQQKNVNDINKDNFMTAMSYFAGYGPMSTYKNQMMLVSLPYKDKNNKIQSPSFFIKKIKEFYDKLNSLL